MRREGKNEIEALTTRENTLVYFDNEMFNLMSKQYLITLVTCYFMTTLTH